MGVFNARSDQPEMEGVRTPSPMTQQVPTRATMSKRFCINRLRSKKSLTAAARRAGRAFWRSSWYEDRFRSSGPWFVARLILACRHINEYNANVPPAGNHRLVFCRLAPVYKVSGPKTDIFSISRHLLGCSWVKNTSNSHNPWTLANLLCGGSTWIRW